jgi:hypothetical protein
MILLLVLECLSTVAAIFQSFNLAIKYGEVLEAPRLFLYGSVLVPIYMLLAYSVHTLFGVFL